MSTDVVIGLASGYDWTAVEPFSVSLVRSGYSGSKVLFVKDLTAAARSNLTSLGFELVDIPAIEFADPQTPLGKYFPYVGRFLLIHKYLEKHPHKFVFCSDTRDVVFQGNPLTWMEKNIGSHKLVAASECVLHRDQPGNVARGLNKGLRRLSRGCCQKEIYCSGFISGRSEYVAEVALSIYLMGRHLSGYVWGADQPVYNAIMHQKAYADITLVPKMSDHYCINLVNLASTSQRKKLLDVPPIASFYTEGKVWTRDLSLLWNWGIPDLSKFTVLHQYDRIDPLAAAIRQEYCLANLHNKPLRFDLSQF